MKQVEKGYEAYVKGERLPNFRTLSGIELKESYTRDDIKSDPKPPGVYPFTRGIHKTMYRERLWTRRQQVGLDTPEESNRRLKYLLDRGMTGINWDGDRATLLGLDPDHELARGTLGIVGTSLATLEDWFQLFDGIPLDKVSSTLIIPPPASAVIMGMHQLTAQRNNVAPDKLIGTIMNCAVTQQAGGTYDSVTYFYPIDFSIKIGLDVMEYCSKRFPKWNILNVNAYNIRETGANAIQEAAFSISLATDYLRRLIERGLDVDDLAPRMGFFCAMHIDFLEEIAKIRAMRRIWAEILKDRFGANKERSLWFRTAIQTSALPLTSQEPLNNIARIAIQTLAAVLAGSQSIHTTGYDEAFATPTEESHRLSVRVQQTIGYETNVCKTVDPLAGSYAIEALTDQLEEEIMSLIDTIENKGGFIECFKQKWIEEQINKERRKYAESLEQGERFSVGVNIFREEEEELPFRIFEHPEETEQRRIEYIKEYKKGRDQDKVKKAFDNLINRFKVGENVMPPIIEALENKLTLGEICEAMRKSQNYEIPHR